MSLWGWITELGGTGQEAYRRETEVGVGRTLGVELEACSEWERMHSRKKLLRGR